MHQCYLLTLRNLDLDIIFPKNIITSGIQNFRIYANVFNLFFIDNLKKLRLIRKYLSTADCNILRP
jgi:hypothetical protein